MRTEKEIRQKLKEIEEARDYVNRAIGQTRTPEATAITQITMGPMIAMLTWVLNDKEEARQRALNTQAAAEQRGEEVEKVELAGVSITDKVVTNTPIENVTAVCPKCGSEMEKRDDTWLCLPWWVDEVWDCTKCMTRIYVGEHR